MQIVTNICVKCVCIRQEIFKKIKSICIPDNYKYTNVQKFDFAIKLQ